MYRFVFVFCVIGIVRTNDDFRVLDAIEQEYLCTQQGGLCTIAADCPKGQLLEQKGLCPAQRVLEVECCYGISVKETRCGRRGGSCLAGKKACSPILTYDEATDCPKNSTCCILVL